MISEPQTTVPYRHSKSDENRCDTTDFGSCESCNRLPISERIIVRFVADGEVFLCCSGCAAFAVLSAADTGVDVSVSAHRADIGVPVGV